MRSKNFTYEKSGVSIKKADKFIKFISSSTKKSKKSGHFENIEIIKTDLENELLYLKGSIPGSKNSEVIVKGSVKNINKLKS